MRGWLKKQIEQALALARGGNADAREALEGMVRERRVLQARAVPATVDEKTRSMEFVATTEAPVDMIDWDRWEVVPEVLLASGFRIRGGGDSTPFIDSHDRSTVFNAFGRAREWKKESDRVSCRVYFDGDETSLKVYEKYKSGTLTDVSIGYDVLLKVYVAEKTSSTVGGKSFKGPVNVATEWEVGELSGCIIGADRDAKVRAQGDLDRVLNQAARGAASPQTKGGNAMKTRSEVLQLLAKARADGNVEEIRHWTAELQAIDAIEASERAAAAAAAAAAAKGGDRTDRPNQPDTPGAKKTEDELREEGMRAERVRCEDIRSLGEMARMDADVVEKAIKDGLSVDAARKAFAKAFEEKRKLPDVPGKGPDIQVGQDKDRASRTEAICHAFMRRSNVLPMEGGEIRLLATRKTIKAHERSNEFMDLSLQGLMRRTLRENGVRGVEDLEGLALVNAVRGHRTSASDLNNILGGVINRSLEIGWGLAETSWRKIAKRVSVKDFNTLRLIARGGFGLMRQVGNDAEVPLTELGDGKYETLTITTFSDRIVISDETFINDDIGALTDLPMQKGMMADQTVNHLVLYTLTQGSNNVGPTMNEDSKALFHTDHGNLQTTGAAPGATTLAAARAALRKMTRPSSVPDAAAVPLNLQPRWVMVPTAHEDAVLTLLSGESLWLPGANNNTVNIWRGALQPIIEPVLDSGATVHLKTGDVSSTAVTAGWYVGTDPMQHAALVAGFLRGNENPTFENDRPLEYLGEEWRTTLRVGAGVQDYRGVYFNDGA